MRVLPQDAEAVMRCLLTLAALAWSLASHAAISVQDDSGRAVTLQAPAQRVVSLAPNLTEMAFAVGAGASIKGIIRYSDFPDEARRLPVVGDAFALDFEGIARLKPDLVLVWTSGLNERHRARLRALGLTVFESEIRGPAGIADTLRRFGTLFGHEREGAAAAERFEAAWDALRERHAGRPPVRVFWQLWQDPLMTVNRTHLIGEAIAACGGVNVFGSLPLLTPTVSWEAAVRADPQVIASSGRESNAERDFAHWRRFSQVSAVRRQQFAFVDGDLIGRMGPRFVQGAAALCDAIDRARQR